MNQKTDSVSAVPPRKPSASLFFATAGYVGYIPKAPGTWGSLVGILLFWVLSRNPLNTSSVAGSTVGEVIPGTATIIVSIVLAFGGAWVANEAAKFAAKKDPQFVVIDEVSGQLFTFLFALVPANWKYLALGLILFRVFDIWKPFPVRQAESLPGGWGIMADDWVAAVYAAIGIWIARAFGF